MTPGDHSKALRRAAMKWDTARSRLKNTDQSDKPKWRDAMRAVRVARENYQRVVSKGAQS